jgi:hypothetical protein
MSVRSSAPAARRGSVFGLAVLAGVLACTVAACGGSSNAATPAASSAPSGQAGGAGGGQGTPPGAFGTAAAVSGSNIEVQNPTNGQVTVTFNGSTKFLDNVSGTLADVTTGECVSVIGTAAGTGKVTATAVTITPAAPNGCTGGAGGFGGGRAGGGRPSGAPRPSGTPRPSGGARPGAGGGRAVGTVASVSGSTFTVQGAARNGNTPAPVTVTVTGTTTYSKTETATSSAVAVGDCIAALGKPDDTGAVTATSITISKPGPNGCSTGFGGRNRGGNGSSNG